MRIEWTNHTVMVNVDGEAAHKITSSHSGISVMLRPVRVRVDVYRDGEAKATVEGYKVRKDGTDAVNQTDVRYHPESSWNKTPVPAYVTEAIHQARKVIAQGHI